MLQTILLTIYVWLIKYAHSSSNEENTSLHHRWGAHAIISGFNAFLKTLEEPPKHYFLFGYDENISIQRFFYLVVGTDFKHITVKVKNI
jgi:heme/copper-type cytochrome/quinol oxidase subunit 3